MARRVGLLITVVVWAFAMIGMAAVAAPPPPPLEYVWDAGKLLTDKTIRDPARLAIMFSDDVTVFENGRQVAEDKAAWLRLLAADLAHYNGRVIGFSESSGVKNGDGALLVVDTFDTVDRTDLLPTFLADPRMATRSTLYQFGADHLIHIVRIARTDGFWMTPRP